MEYLFALFLEAEKHVSATNVDLRLIKKEHSDKHKHQNFIIKRIPQDS